MNAIRQQLRPKHQVLVLKCYPRHMKNNVEVKPNSSELSYLLYYASTRRSKLQKVGDFLDKRVASDVWKGRIGYVGILRLIETLLLTTASNVQVALQILKALIEKCPRDLPLFASAALKIFRTILKSLDVTMIEETLPTWAAFCAHQDPAVLAADQDFLRQYEEIVAMYASFASKDTPVTHKSAKSVPIRIRFRKAGLGAIKAIAESESITTETARQLALIIPPVLENIYSDKGEYLRLLEYREEEKLEFEKEIAIRRRQSTSTVRTADANGNADPVAASGSTEAADRLAEQETGVIALQALKPMFSGVPRSSLRLATAEVLQFIGKRIKPHEHFPYGTMLQMHAGSWPSTLFAMVCGWAPVQDRYVILVTAVEELVKGPLEEDDLDQQYVLATLVSWLLCSDINFIGLSIMDVLVGLLQHVLALLHRSAYRSASPQLEKVPSSRQEAEITDVTNGSTNGNTLSDASTMTANEEVLLEALQKCIGCLAVHVYYTDQVSDMITAILYRLKPATQPTAALSSASTVENVNTGTDGAGSSSSLAEKPSADGHFSFGIARVAALKSIKEILIWANSPRPDGSSNSSSRTAIRTDKWEGTSWMLRDHNWRVRLAYADMLLTWTSFELKKMDQRAPEPIQKTTSKTDKKTTVSKEAALARRAVSNASQRDKSPKRAKTAFLQLLHLAVYDNSLQYGTSDADILLLHLLITNFAARLGVNSIQYGLPMVFRLQDDLAEVENSIVKVNLGSLVHGYLWALGVFFHFDAAATGRDIILEINRRQRNGLWLPELAVPALPLDEIERKFKQQEANRQSPENTDPVELKRFEHRSVLIDKISQGYSVTVASPPASPPTSPQRKFSSPILEQHTQMIAGRMIQHDLPGYMRENMMVDWSREAVIAATGKHDGSRSGSLSGSPTATGSSGRHLTVNAAAAAGAPNGDLPSPRRSHQGQHLHHTHSPFRGSRPNTALHQPHALRDALAHTAGGSRSRGGSQAGTPLSATSSVRSSVRVEDLKRVLSGAPVPLQTALSGIQLNSTGLLDQEIDSGSDSMVSYEGSELSYAPVDAAAGSSKYAPTSYVHHAKPSQSMSPTNKGPTSESLGQTEKIPPRTPVDEDAAADKDAGSEGSMTPRPPTATTTLAPKPSLAHRSSISEEPEMEEIPPVPPLPASLRGSEGLRASYATHTSNPSSTDTSFKSPPTSPPPRSPSSGSNNTASRAAIPAIKDATAPAAFKQASNKRHSQHSGTKRHASTPSSVRSVSVGPGKARTPSVRSASTNVRDSLVRSISSRDIDSPQLRGTPWTVAELLDSIDTDGFGAPPGSKIGVAGSLKPPY
jgi:hypothetical protein